MRKLPYTVFIFVGVMLLIAGYGQAATPQRGGTLIIALSGEPAALSAHYTTDTAAWMVSNVDL